VLQQLPKTMVYGIALITQSPINLHHLI